MSRYTEAIGTRGAVATAHYLASQAGLWMLRRGGNAVDAAVCAAATIAAVCPNLNGVGGDVFAQVWPPGEAEPVGLNASGRSGSFAEATFVRGRGHDTIPARGPLSINVPGAVSGWMLLLERFGTRRLYDVLEPAIDYAANGAPVTAGIERALKVSEPFLRTDPGFQSVFWRDGRLLIEGQIFVNRALADTLTEIGATDGEAMYRGPIARKLASGLHEYGSMITEDDLAAHTAEWIDPLQTDFGGLDVYELPPNTQGLAAIEMLNMAELCGVPSLEHNSCDYVDRLCQVVGLAIEDRDRYVTDPAFSIAPLGLLTSREYARDRLTQFTSTPRDASDADTIYLCVVDSSGMGVSLIQSQYMGFGSGYLDPATGIHLNNRGSYFSLDGSHVNRLEPRKRTMHTLIPGMAGMEGRPSIVFGTMGGDAQPQIHLQVLLNHLYFGMTLQEAIEAPRFAWSPQGGNRRRVSLESRFDDSTIKQLKSRGYHIQMLEPWSGQVGHAQAIGCDRENGTYRAAADPRGDGLAIAY